MEKSSLKLLFLVVLLIVAVYEGVARTCKTDADCGSLPDICDGNPPYFLICTRSGRCGCKR
ncbi:hypothetical protein TanjilG_23313 [Lupinus angustifolius]|uniref:Late nodulin n=1 Tax=Lupinus angustifolius TaxID=3871 RepID=A0A1J7GGY0_LUPAN|nr:hypothetical protein TanjilG_23313 [Lupinus angustifolius]